MKEADFNTRYLQLLRLMKTKRKVIISFIIITTHGSERETTESKRICGNDPCHVSRLHKKFIATHNGKMVEINWHKHALNWWMYKCPKYLSSKVK